MTKKILFEIFALFHIVKIQHSCKFRQQAHLENRWINYGAIKHIMLQYCYPIKKNYECLKLDDVTTITAKIMKPTDKYLSRSKSTLF